MTVTRMKRMKPNVPLHAGAIALAVLGPFLMLGGLVAHAWIPACVGAALVFLGKLPWLYVSERHVGVKREDVDVEANEGGLVIDGKERIAASEITEAVMWPNATEGQRPTVRVRTGKWLPAVELEVATWDEGQSILRAIGFDAAHKPAKFTTFMPKLFLWGQIGVIGLPMAVMSVLFFVLHRHPHSYELAAYMMSSMAAAVAAIRIPRHIEVRPDALAMRFMRWEERIPWTDVESITRSFNSGTIKLKSGRTIELRGVGTAASTLPEGQRGDDALTERVIEAHAAATTTTTTKALVERPRATVSALPETVTVLHARIWAWVVTYALFTAAVIALFAGRHQHWAPMVAAPAFLAGFAFQIFATFRPNRLTRGHVEQRPEGLAIGDRVIVRDTIENAYVQPALAISPLQPKVYKNRPRVVFVGRKRRHSIDVLVENEGEGNALLRALALDPTHAVASFTARSGLIDNSAAQVVLFMLLMGGTRLIPRVHGAARWALVAATIFALVNALWPTKIRVGADGILVKTLRKKTFHAYADIESADASGNGVVLVLRSGKRVSIATTPVRGNASTTRDALLKRISDGLAAARGTNEDLGRLLAREGRTAHDWLTSLRALGAGQASGYRVASVDAQKLWAVVEDASAKPEARASAAAALRVADEASTARLRAAAEATASPKLRVALEVATTNDDAALEQALAECAEGEDERAREA